MQEMSEAEWRAFLLAGTRTAKLATLRPDGRPYIAPVWFIVDHDTLVFTTMAGSVKGRNLRAGPRLAICVDEEAFPYAFVLIEAAASISELPPGELLPWTTRIARRYVGDARAEAYGRRNAVEGEVLVRVPLTQVIARKSVAA